MTSEDRSIKATCLCGRAAHTITLPQPEYPLKACFCSCNSCRHMTGTLILSVVFLPRTYQPTQQLLDQLDGFEFSRKITQYHCKTCGTMVIGRCLDDPDKAEPTVTWDITTGTLEKWDGEIDVQGFVHLSDTLDGGFADFLPSLNGKTVERWPGHFRHGEQLPPGWRAIQTTQVNALPSDRLHAHCKCNGVQFWIARPSDQSKQAECSWPDVLVPSTSGKTENPDNEPWWLQANGTKFLAGTCACDSCRLASGTDIVEWAFVPTIDITLDAEGKVPFQRQFGTLRRYDSSPGVTRHFCARCGAMVFFESHDRPRLLDVAVGLLDAPEGARAETWLEWHTERLSFREDAMPRAASLAVAVEEGLEAFARREQIGSQRRRLAVIKQQARVEGSQEISHR